MGRWIAALAVLCVARAHTHHRHKGHIRKGHLKIGSQLHHLQSEFAKLYKNPMAVKAAFQYAPAPTPAIEGAENAYSKLTGAKQRWDHGTDNFPTPQPYTGVTEILRQFNAEGDFDDDGGDGDGNGAYYSDDDASEEGDGDGSENNGKIAKAAIVYIIAGKHAGEGGILVRLHGKGQKRHLKMQPVAKLVPGRKYLVRIGTTKLVNAVGSAMELKMGEACPPFCQSNSCCNFKGDQHFIDECSACKQLYHFDRDTGVRSPLDSCFPGAAGYTKDLSVRKMQCRQHNKAKKSGLREKLGVKHLYVEKHCPFFCDNPCCHIVGDEYLKQCKPCSTDIKCNPAAKDWKKTLATCAHPPPAPTPPPQPGHENCPIYCNQYCCELQEPFFYKECQHCGDGIECAPGKPGWWPHDKKKRADDCHGLSPYAVRQHKCLKSCRFSCCQLNGDVTQECVGCGDRENYKCQPGSLGYSASMDEKEKACPAEQGMLGFQCRQECKRGCCHMGNSQDGNPIQTSDCAGCDSSVKCNPTAAGYDTKRAGDACRYLLAHSKAPTTSPTTHLKAPQDDDATLTRVVQTKKVAACVDHDKLLNDVSGGNLPDCKVALGLCNHPMFGPQMKKLCCHTCNCAGAHAATAKSNPLCQKVAPTPAPTIPPIVGRKPDDDDQAMDSTDDDAAEGDGDGGIEDEKLNDKMNIEKVVDEKGDSD